MGSAGSWTRFVDHNGSVRRSEAGGRNRNAVQRNIYLARIIDVERTLPVKTK